MRIRLLIAFVGLGMLAACLQNEDGRSTMTPADPRIETCGGGSSVELSASVKADLTEILKGDAEIDASTERKVSTALGKMAGALSEESFLRFQENFLQCLRDEAKDAARAAALRKSPWQSYTAEQCVGFTRCEERVMVGVRTCRETLSEMGRAYGRCYDGLTERLTGCYEVTSGDHLRLSRSFCETNHGIVPKGAS